MHADPLSTYPTAKQLSELKVDQWFKLGLQLGLPEDQLESLKNSSQPTAATLLSVKAKNIDLKWKPIVECILLIGEYKAVEMLFVQQGSFLFSLILIQAQ